MGLRAFCVEPLSGRTRTVVCSAAVGDARGETSDPSVHVDRTQAGVAHRELSNPAADMQSTVEPWGITFENREARTPAMEVALQGPRPSGVVAFF